MGNKSTFEFDPVLKKWVNKVGGMIVQEENVLAPPPMMPAYNYEPTTLRSRKYVDILNKTDNGSESSPFELPGFPKASYTIPGYSDLPSTKSNTPIGFQLPSMPSANFTVEPDIHNDQSLTKNYSQTNSQMFSVPNLNSATDRDGTFDTNTSNDHVHQFSQSPRAQTLSQFGNGIESNQPYDNSVYDANTISAQRNHHTEISHVMPHGQSIDNFMDAPQPYDPLLNTTQPFDPLMNTTQPYDPLLNPVFESCYQNDTQYPNSSLDNVNKNGTLSNNPDKIHLHSDNAETRASFNLANQLSKNVHESMNQCLSPNLSTQKVINNSY